MQMNSERIRQSFSSAAESYDRHNSIQATIARRLIEFLPEEREFKSILEVGCGTGLYTKLLVERFPEARIYSLDISSEMVNRARQHVKEENVTWMTGDAREVLLDEKVTLVTGSASVHWAQPLDELFANLNRQLYNRGRLVINVMLQGTLEELHELRSRVAPDKYEAPVLPGRQQVVNRLEESGFEILREKRGEIVQNYESAEQFLISLNEQGVAPCSSGSSPQLNRGELEELQQLYAEEYATEEGVEATYDLLEIEAVKNGE